METFVISIRWIIGATLPFRAGLSGILVGVFVFSLGIAQVSASESTFSIFPVRPANASRILATEGVFVGYTLHAKNRTLSATIQIYDEIQKRKREFLVGSNFQVDSRLIRCVWPPIKAPVPDIERAKRQLALCGTLPANLIPGKTHVVVIYWRESNRLVGNAVVTDSIISIPNSSMLQVPKSSGTRRPPDVEYSRRRGISQ